MRANDTTFIKFLYQPQKIKIPIYQRKYSWGQTECTQLFNDIEEIGKKESKTHFMGSIVHQSYSTPMHTLITAIELKKSFTKRIRQCQK